MSCVESFTPCSRVSSQKCEVVGEKIFQPTEASKVFPSWSFKRGKWRDFEPLHMPFRSEKGAFV